MSRRAFGLVPALFGLVLSLAPITTSAERDAIAPASDDELAWLSRRLGPRLREALADECLSNARVGLVVRELETGAALFHHRGDELLVPASNMKLLTAGALLSLAGPEVTLITQVRADRAPDGKGAVGRIYLVGGGDPSFNIEALYLAARAVAAAGVRRVEQVVADDSMFAGPDRPTSWPARLHPHWYGAPSSALCAGFNVVAVHAQAPRDGGPTRVWLDPFPEHFQLVDELRVGKGALSVTSERLDGASRAQRVTVRGRIRAGRSERVLRAVEQPALFAAAGLTESLRRVGIEVEKKPTLGRDVGESVVLHSHVSRPLAQVVTDMNKHSSNVFAETLLRWLGGRAEGFPGTREKGVRVLERFLVETSGSCTGCVVADGSGLSSDSRLTAQALTDLLLALSRDRQVWPELLTGLPVGGVDGTLRRRLDEPGRARQVRAKTGRLAKVVSLSGVAPVAPEQEAVFALLVNDYHCPTWKVQDAVDDLVAALIADAPRAKEPSKRLESLTARGGSGGPSTSGSGG
ncbi:MAG: D-alanyl-D-alanine carboxypeptidase/D-alanyl-D-alanine-endopeptidase [Acidobacteriota bacterium]